MSSISYLNSESQDPNDYPIPFSDARDSAVKLASNEPTATPLADLLAASDPAGMDAECLPFEEWRAIYTEVLA